MRKNHARSTRRARRLSRFGQTADSVVEANQKGVQIGWRAGKLERVGWADERFQRRSVRRREDDRHSLFGRQLQRGAKVPVADLRQSDIEQDNVGMIVLDEIPGGPVGVPHFLQPRGHPMMAVRREPAGE
jgi:hypothetical protein